MTESTLLILFAIGALAVLILGAFAMFAKFYRKVEQGTAMIVNTLRAAPEVTFTGRMVYPVIHKAELMDISLKTIDIDRSGDQGLICQDNIRADIKVKFFVRVNQTSEDVLRVAQGIGCARASNQQTLEDLFSAKFSEALKTVGKSLDFVDLYQARDRFRDKIIEQIGDDLSGYVLEDAAIDYLEQTPLAKLDATNILDAQGIKKITELTAVEHVVTNELRRNEEMQIKKKDVETQEALLELERQQADATARQKREVDAVAARRVGGESDGGFEAGFGHAHNVVVRNGTNGAQVAQGNDCGVAALHHRTGGFCQCGQAVCGNFVGGVEGFAADAVEEIAVECFARGEGDGVYQAVEAVPAFAQVGKQLLDFGIALYVAAEYQLRTEFFGHFAYALFEFVHHIGECQFRALFAAGFGDAVSDGTLGDHAGNQDFFALQEAHVDSPWLGDENRRDYSRVCAAVEKAV